MHKDISPEEKLLSIIKGKPNIPENGQPKPETKDASPLPSAAWGKIDDFVSAILKNDLFKNSVLDARYLKVFNKYAVIVITLITAYLFLDIILVSPSRKAEKLLAAASASAPIVAPIEKTMPIETKSYSYYSNRMSGKSMFGAGSYMQTESQAPGSDASAETSGGDLGLVGIIPGDTRQAIVEDKKNQKTYYLIKGQSINGITVEDISEDKVILEYREKKMTLFL
ncbi:MAG: hypothetical protein Q7S30_02860 [Candidatus Omnitrophota bacterium]|nr:hypothetical protein [Candidatus Omnitrophota bacterium]